MRLKAKYSFLSNWSIWVGASILPCQLCLVMVVDDDALDWTYLKMNSPTVNCMHYYCYCYCCSYHSQISPDHVTSLAFLIPILDCMVTTSTGDAMENVQNKKIRGRLLATIFLEWTWKKRRYLPVFVTINVDFGVRFVFGVFHFVLDG